MSNFIDDIFMPQFYKQTWKRGRNETFKNLMKYLEDNNIKNPIIVETGTTRLAHKQAGDGHATRIFDAYINYYDGQVYSIDIDKKACECAKSLVSKKSNIICSDSVKYLNEFNKKIDLLYLDSFDFNSRNPEPSMKHHLKELLASLKNLKPGSLVVVDDNKVSDKGKGYYVKEHLLKLNAKILFDEYQLGFIFP